MTSSNLLGTAPRKTTRLSPLSYPGGKFRARKIIRHYFPKNVKEMVSPFFGGGHIELDCAADGIKVHGYDAYDRLINFWKHIQSSAPKVRKEAWKFYPMTRDKFYSLREEYESLQCNIKKAAVFWSVHKSSFSKMGFSKTGISMKENRFNPKQINLLGDFHNNNFTIDCADFKHSLSHHSDIFAYCDPPYLLGKSFLYGINGQLHKDFDHIGLCEQLKARDNWVLSYNNTPEIREMYAGYDFVYPQFKYSMGNKLGHQQETKEILIINTGIKPDLIYPNLNPEHPKYPLTSFFD